MWGDQLSKRAIWGGDLWGTWPRVMWPRLHLTRTLLMRQRYDIVTTSTRHKNSRHRWEHSLLEEITINLNNLFPLRFMLRIFSYSYSDCENRCVRLCVERISLSIRWSRSALFYHLFLQEAQLSRVQLRNIRQEANDHRSMFRKMKIEIERIRILYQRHIKSQESRVFRLNQTAQSSSKQMKRVSFSFWFQNNLSIKKSERKIECINTTIRRFFNKRRWYWRSKQISTLNHSEKS
jgi:hypothetical protein